MLITLGLLGCGADTADADLEPAPLPSVDLEVPRHVSLFGVIPQDMFDGDPPGASLIELGRMVYFDARLSADHSVSCNSCHPLERYGASPEATSGGVADPRPARNAPSTFNAALQFRQYWDGREPDIEAQVREAFVNPQEMGMETQSAVVAAVNSIPGYREAFAAAFPGDEAPIRYGSVTTAVAAFLRTLTTPNSKLDQYQSGEGDAPMTDAELAGFELFVSTGCISCHAGPLLGGAMFQRLGAVHPYATADLGIGATSGKPTDARLFKVPSLRNVAMTGPWFNDGSVKSLPDAVRAMAHHQLGRSLDDAQVASIVGFLQTLTGELPDSAVEPPELP